LEVVTLLRCTSKEVLRAVTLKLQEVTRKGRYSWHGALSFIICGEKHRTYDVDLRLSVSLLHILLMQSPLGNHRLSAHHEVRAQIQIVYLLSLLIHLLKGVLQDLLLLLE